MLTAGRTVLAASCAALFAMACGGGPTAPSSNGGTTIAGIVSVSGGAATLPGGAASSLTVTIVGTNRTANVDESGYFQIADVPRGRVRLQFKDAFVDATAEIQNVGSEAIIEITVQISGSAATIVNEVRSEEKVALCHRNESGTFNLISVGAPAEPAHMAHGDGKPGGDVPGQPNRTFDENCRVAGPSVRIETSTNGEDADNAPGPRIPVGSTVSWEYRVTNTGTIALTGIQVVDDRNVVVTCPSTSLTPGQSMTCTGSGTATAGQYRNVGRVTASSTMGQVTDEDASHYFGFTPNSEEQPGQMVTLCHRTGNGSYQLLTVSVSAEPAHLAHGDGYPGQAVPGVPGRSFSASCSVQ